MKICPFCHKEIPLKALVCPHPDCRRVLVEHTPGRKTPIVFQASEQPKQKATYQASKGFSDPRRLWRSNNKGWVVSVIILSAIVIGYTIADNNPQSDPISPVTQSTQQPAPISQVPTQIFPQPQTGAIIGNTKNLLFLQGGGKLTISNGTGNDAIAKLVASSIGKSIYTVYIRSGGSYTIENISDGTYTLAFALGNNWDPSIKHFTEDNDQEQFGNPFNFSVHTTNDGNYIDTYTVTLNAVPDGTATTTPIDQSEFDSY